MAKDTLDTRQLILRAALKRFANGGYAATSVQDIVDDAQVSKPARYYHFKDKEELLGEVARLLLLKVPDIRSDERPLEEWIVTLCVTTRRTILQHPKAAGLMLQFSRAICC